MRFRIDWTYAELWTQLSFVIKGNYLGKSLGRFFVSFFFFSRTNFFICEIRWIELICIEHHLYVKKPSIEERYMYEIQKKSLGSQSFKKCQFRTKLNYGAWWFVVKAMVFPVVMDRCESWTIQKAEHWRTDAFELWCWRRLFRVPWAARRSNQSIQKEINSVQLLICIQLFVTPWNATQVSLSITNSWSLLKLIPTESVMLWNHLILCHPLLLLPSIFPSIMVFSEESALHIRWPKYWSFSFNIYEYSGLIPFRVD